MTPSTSYYNPAATRRTRRLILLAATLCIIACMSLVHIALPRAAGSPVVASMTVPYVAKALGNQLAIYVEGENMPALVTDIDVRSLPEADRSALARGVTLPTDEALAKLLEDYSS